MSEVRRYTTEEIAEMKVDPGFVTEADYDTLRAQAMRLRQMVAGSRRSHYYCEDSWYSCPKSEDGCSDKRQGNECNCGADEKNAAIDVLLRETADLEAPHA